MRTQKTLASFALIYLVLSLVSLRAQPTAVQQMENLQRNMEQQQPMISLKSGTNAPELYPGENEDIGPQHILKVKQHHTMFEVGVNSQFFYTANALLTQTGQKSTAVAVNTIQAAFTPGPFKLGNGKFSPSVGYLSQWYNYGLDGVNDGLDALDFNVQKAFLNGSYQLSKNWQLYGSFEYNRLLSQPSYREFYHEFVPGLGVQRSFQINENLLFVAGLSSAYHFTEVNTVIPPTPTYINDRWDNTLNLSLSYQIIPRLVVQPYYYFQYTYYPQNTVLNGSRNDYLNSFGLSVSYYFNQNVSLRAFISRDVKSSDDPFVQKYWNCNLGLDLSLVLRF